MTDRTQHIFLIPGFGHVCEFLTRSFEELGIDVRIQAVRNYATSSTRKRTLWGEMIHLAKADHFVIRSQA